MKLVIRRACAHDSARACMLILAWLVFCGSAELICRLRGVGSIE